MHSIGVVLALKWQCKNKNLQISLILVYHVSYISLQYFSSTPPWFWWTGGSSRKWKLAVKLSERDSEPDLSLRIIWWSTVAAWQQGWSNGALLAPFIGISTTWSERCCTNWDTNNWPELKVVSFCAHSKIQPFIQTFCKLGRVNK